MRQLYGRHALVTGGAMGMGKSLSRLLLLEGMKVTIIDINEDELEKTCSELSGLGHITSHVCDVSDRKAVNALADFMDKDYGGIDLLVNNAGIAESQPLIEKSDLIIEKTIAVNLLSHFWTIKAFLPGMIERGRGHIVNMASAAGILGVPYISDYSASKFGDVGLSESLRQELRLTGRGFIRVTYVCPSTVGTGMFEGNTPVTGTRILDQDEVAARMVTAIKRNREKVFIPAFLHTGAVLKSILPVPAMDLITRLLGVATCSANMTGRQAQA